MNIATLLNNRPLDQAGEPDDPEGGGLAHPSVKAWPEAGGGQEALPLRHDAPLQQQQGEPEDRPADVGLAGKSRVGYPSKSPNLSCYPPKEVSESSLKQLNFCALGVAHLPRLHPSQELRGTEDLGHGLRSLPHAPPPRGQVRVRRVESLGRHARHRSFKGEIWMSCKSLLESDCIYHSMSWEKAN